MQYLTGHVHNSTCDPRQPPLNPSALRALFLSHFGGGLSYMQNVLSVLKVGFNIQIHRASDQVECDCTTSNINRCALYLSDWMLQLI